MEDGLTKRAKNLKGAGQIQPNPGQVTRQSETHPCLVFSTNGSGRSLVYSENVPGPVSYTRRMSLELCRIIGECRPALAVVCPLFPDNGGQLHLLSLPRPVFSNNVGQLVKWTFYLQIH